MKIPLKIFVDSDVVISSLISKSGAAYLLLSKENQRIYKLYISNISKKEIEKVIQKLKLNKTHFSSLLQANLNVVRLESDAGKLQDGFLGYTNDIGDTHIVAGAKTSEASFLISYNTRDFKIEKIHRDLDIIVVTPGQFLQYLRSLK